MLGAERVMPWYSSPLEDVLHSGDVMGAKGCLEIRNRSNLLIECLEFITWDHCDAIRFRQFAPEGFGIQEYGRPHMECPADSVINEDLIMLWDVTREYPPLQTKLWIFDVEEVDIFHHCYVSIFKFDARSKWAHTPSPSFEHPFKCLDLFCGAYGGWKHATTFLKSFLGIETQTVGIEIDWNTVQGYALTHHTNIVTVREDLPHDLFLNGENWVLHSSIQNKQSISAICKWQPNMVTISSPCVAWSNASTRDGLYSTEGRSFAEAIVVCRWVRPQVIRMENVVGFGNHPQKNHIVQLLHWIGYKIVWERLLDARAHSQTKRSRWLAIAARIHEDLFPNPFQHWPLQVPDFPKDYIMDMDQHCKAKLFLSQEAIRIASHPMYSKFASAGATSESILASRTHDASMKIPTFMAMYGSQHLLSLERLAQFGYLGHFASDSSAPANIRHWHPTEIAILHGLTQQVFLSDVNQDSWRWLGNMISLPHSLLIVTNMINRLQSQPLDVKDTFIIYHNHLYTASQCQMTPLSFGYMLMRKGELITTKFAEAASQLQTLRPQDDFFLWSPKHGLISHEQYESMQLQPAIPQSAPACLSAVTSDEESTSYSPTIRFQPILKGTIKLDTHEVPFWFSADLDSRTIESISNGYGRMNVRPHSNPWMQLKPLFCTMSFE